MASRTQTEQKVEAQLQALETLSHAELKEHWNARFEAPCPPHMSRKFLLRAVAYRMQENAFGGLSKAVRRRLEKVATDLAAGRDISQPRAQIKPGTRLLREWQGVVHEVIRFESSVQYRGERWPWLSAVAREITGARWSGPRFFGLTGSAHGRR